MYRGVRKHSNLGGPQRLNRIDLYGKKLIPMEIWEGHGPPGSYAYAYVRMHVSSYLLEIQ